jgi:TDG/mug DNA glycosylase family protein
MTQSTTPTAEAPHLLSFPPIADANARVLILGTMPGKESLRAAQYYAHPRNAFWKIMGELVGAGFDLPYDARVQKLKAARIAVWDVLASCVRESSLDADIDADTMVVNDFESFYNAHPKITDVFFNGAIAEKFYRIHTQSLHLHRVLNYQRLPSTSPAHAGMRYAQKLQAWQAVAKAAC